MINIIVILIIFVKTKKANTGFKQSLEKIRKGLHMKTFSLVKFLIILLLFNHTLIAQWVNSKFDNNNWAIASVQFFNTQTGFIASVDRNLNGILYNTTNSGENWQPQLQLTNQNGVFSLFFVNDMTGYGIGLSETFIKTTNGGLNWDITKTNLEGRYGSLHFVNTQTGYAAGGNDKGDKGYVAGTTDGGTTWRLIYWQGYGYHSVFFTNESTGYVSGEAGTILKTSDGGITWKTTFSDGGNSLICIKFTNENTGFVFGGNKAGNKGIILKTTDGGTTWEEKENAPGAITSAFIINDNMYAAGNNGLIIKSTDGGNSWLKQNSPSGNILFSVYFLDNNKGFITGGNGTLLTTVNGGE